jgi:hypothetical protein
MTTSSKRRVVRGTALALFLSASIALASNVSPHPFGYNSWPQPPAPTRAAPIVEVRPDSPVAAPEAAVRRARPQGTRPSAAKRHARPEQRPQPAHRAVVSEPSAPAAPQRASAPPKQPSKDPHHGHGGGGPDSTGRSPVPVPEPEVPETPEVHVAQAAPGELAAPVQAKVSAVLAPQARHERCDEDQDGPEAGYQGD